MIHGVGTDILSVSRMGNLPEEDAFVRKTFTEKERREIFARREPQMGLCTRFAGKEAVFKALRIDSDTARLNEIEILAEETGAPFVTLHGRLAERAAEMGIRTVHLSLSWETDYALAFAVAEK